ncbi:MAG: hypothetical protein AB1404_12440 [Spirochaetota bacterium]
MKLDVEKVLDWLHTRRMVLFAVLGGTVLLLIGLLLIVQVDKPKVAKHTLSQAYAAEPIPRKELFVEEEPDFVPSFLYYRAPREAWDAEFVSQFWDPLDDKTLQDLQKEADNRISTLLEAIP